MKRQEFPTDYDTFAPLYARTRSAAPWVLEVLQRAASRLSPTSWMVEIGCGTGNYIRAISSAFQELRLTGLDLSLPMLREARRDAPHVTYVAADAGQALPFREAAIDLAFAVDVIHHIGDLFRLFAELARVTQPSGDIVIVTDSEETFRRRSLSVHFPELLPIERARYPGLPELHEAAGAAALQVEAEYQVTGEVPLSDEFVAALEAKCSSAMRLISPSDHAAGMARVRAAQRRGERWLSCYEVLCFSKRSRV